MSVLHRLVYYSRNRISGPAEAIGCELRQILAASQRNNAPAGVTGALMFNAGCFAQVLEGAREVVESTFERIQRDERHGDVSLLEFGAVEARLFSHWSMGFVGRRPDHLAIYGALGTQSGFDPAQASGDRIVAHLLCLALEEESLA